MLSMIRNGKGQVLVLFVVFIGVLLGVAALALDLGRAYGVKARLHAAVDAASFEATRALAQGTDESQMKTQANAVALAYFHANYPANYLGATPDAPVVTPEHDSTTGLWKVTVTATAQMPTILAGLAGASTLKISTASQAQRRTLDMSLVLDTTSSLEDDFPAVLTSAQDFVDYFSVQDDRIALVAFASGAAPIVSICREAAPFDVPPNPPPPQQIPAAESLDCDRGFNKGGTSSPKGIKDAINNLRMSDDTNFEQGLTKGLYQLNSLRPAARASTRAIVFFSDGAPNTLKGRFQTAPSGTVEGNLYSGYSGAPGAVYDPAIYNDAQRSGGGGVSRTIAALPEMGGDPANQVPLASYHNKRTLSGGTSSHDLHCDINRAARNMAENMANTIRNQGIYVFTIGFGTNLDSNEIGDCDYTSQENGANILKRLANTKNSDTYNSSQPAGIYCQAPTPAQLGSCFEMIASALLRITR